MRNMEIQLDELSRECIQEIVDGEYRVEEIIFELGMLTPKSELQRLINRGRLLWMRKNGLKGGALLQALQTHDNNHDALLIEIDGKRKQQNDEEMGAEIQRLCLCLNIDQRYLPLIMKDLKCSVADILNLLKIAAQVGMNDDQLNLLHTARYKAFTESLLNSHSAWSVRRQNYENAKHCAHQVITESNIRTFTLVRMKELINSKLECTLLHHRALILLALIKVDWKGSLRNHIQRLYDARSDWRDYLPPDATNMSLCCYILLCERKSIVSVLAFMKVFNEHATQLYQGSQQTRSGSNHQDPPLLSQLCAVS